MDNCSLCKIRIGCDILSEMCRLTPREIVIHRSDLIGNGQHRNRMKMAVLNAPIFAATRARQQATAALGLGKYDRRRKHSRGYWRDQK